MKKNRAIPPLFFLTWSFSEETSKGTCIKILLPDDTTTTNVFKIVCKKNTIFSPKISNTPILSFYFIFILFLICDWIDESSCTFRIQFLQKKEFIVQFCNLKIIVQQYEHTFSFPFPNTSVLIPSDEGPRPRWLLSVCLPLINIIALGWYEGYCEKGFTCTLYDIY